MSEPNWLGQLKVGDKVAVRAHNNPTLIRTVSKILPKSVDVDNRRFSKTDGKERGGDTWSWAEIVPATPEITADVRRRSIASHLNQRIWYADTLETLEAVYALVQAAQKEAEEGKK